MLCNISTTQLIKTLMLHVDRLCLSVCVWVDTTQAVIRHETTESWVLTLSPEFAFHTWTTQQEIFPLVRIHDSTEISVVFWWGVVQQAEAGGFKYIPLQTSHVFVYSTSTPESALITQTSLAIFFRVFYVYSSAFSSWDISFVYFSFFFVHRLLETSSTPLPQLHRLLSRIRSPAVFIHRLLWSFCRLLYQGTEKEIGHLHSHIQHLRRCFYTYIYLA